MLQPFRDQIHEITEILTYLPAEARETIGKQLVEKLIEEFTGGYHGEYEGIFKNRSAEPQD